MEACENACIQMSQNSADSTCTSFTYHSAAFPVSDWRRGCYVVVDGSWMPHNETHVTSGTNGCIHQRDCSFNGNCSHGTCRCAPAWRGKFCEKLATIAGPKALGYQGRDSSGRLSSWGGAVLRDNAGVYHLIGSEMIRHAGLLPWSCNSQVIHATSANPLTQPFVKQRVL